MSKLKQKLLSVSSKCPHQPVAMVTADNVKFKVWENIFKNQISGNRQKKKKV